MLRCLHSEGERGAGEGAERVLEGLGGEPRHLHQRESSHISSQTHREMEMGEMLSSADFL